MLASRLTHALPLLLTLGFLIGPARPADSARYPKVKGSWVGTLSYDNGRPDTDARLFVSWQKKKKCRGTLTARGYNGIPVSGKVTPQGKVVVKVRAGQIRGTIKGWLSEDGNQVAGKWIETNGKKTLTGTFVMQREQD